MSITDELRKWEDKNSIFYSYALELEAIADRIDAEHERCCKALDEAWSATAHQVHESAMGELSDGWVELPKDADGVPIRVGEELDYDGEPLCDIKRFKVNGYAVNMGMLSPTDRENRLFHPKYCRHVQPDSWGRIIEDACKLGFTDPDNDGMKEKIIARCRALAGEDE